MRKTKRLLAALIGVFAAISYQIYYLIPGSVTLQDGETYDFPPLVSTVENDGGTQLRLMGLVPLRTVEVNVVEKKELIPCGNAIGIKINVGGLYVVGLSDIRSENGKKYSPAKDAGLKKGDIIRQVDGQETETAADLTRLINTSEGRPLTMAVERKGEAVTVSVSAGYSADDRAYKLGAWVRDTTSGIGTITFIDPSDQTFGALGHGITDADTGGLVPAEDGEVLRSEIVGIRRGEKGNPGELKGVFSGSGVIGYVEKNTASGVFGRIEGTGDSGQPLPLAMRSQVRLGGAEILSNIEGRKVESYTIEIQRIMKNAVNNKGMVIKVTDARLLAKTGGIVQGMSGSPIIQDGKLIGAVTHVFINDPTRGYGTFIELMLPHTKSD